MGTAMTLPVPFALPKTLLSSAGPMRVGSSVAVECLHEAIDETARSLSVHYNRYPFGSVAQLVEQEPLKLLVAGSSPARPTMYLFE